MGTNSSSASPSHGKFNQRGQLGTSTSDDVFVSPVHVVLAASQETNESTDGGCCDDLDEVKRSESTLEHVRSLTTFCSSFLLPYFKTEAISDCHNIADPVFQSF